jgi:gamma-glutamyltranspeptidase/glutathione hydrolase
MAGAMALAGWNGQARAGGRVPTDSGGIAGLAAVDQKGGAAACSLSMGQLFGARITVRAPVSCSPRRPPTARRSAPW